LDKYSRLTMDEKIDKIGELLAKGVYLYLKEQKKEIEKSPNSCDNIDCLEKGGPLYEQKNSL